MFRDKLAGKQVLLVLEEEYLQRAKAVGIAGSPLYCKIHHVDNEGLWLDARDFRLCPPGSGKLYDAGGKPFCHAHVFIPARAIISIVTFPKAVQAFAKDPSVHKIGFRSARARSKR